MNRFQGADDSGGGTEADIARREPQELEVVSLDRSEPGFITLRVAAPAGRQGPVELDGLAATIAGQPAEVSITPVEVDSMQLALVMDVSGSMAGEPLAAAKASVVDFVASLPDSAEVALIAFGPEATVVEPPTSDREAVIASVEALEAGGETALYDGLQTAIGLSTTAKRLPVVVLSDGGDTVSSATIDDVEELLAQTPHVVHAIDLATAEADAAVLDRLAEMSGGQRSSADDPTELAALYDRLGTTLASEYEVVIPVDRDGPATVEIWTDAGGNDYQWSGVVDLPELTAEVAIEVASSPPTIWTAPPVGLASSAQLLLIGAGLLIGSLVAAIGAWLVGGPSKPRRSSDLLSGGQASNQAAFTDVRRSASTAVEGMFRPGSKAGLARTLDAAGLKMRVGEYLIARGLAVLVGAGVGFSVSGRTGAVIGGLAGYLGPKFQMGFRQSRRRKAFGQQLPDMLMALGNALRVGFSMQRALASVAAEAEEPARTELSRANAEARLGVPLTEALRSVSQRMGSEDLLLVVDAIQINTTVGGDMVAVLENLAEAIRSRVTLNAQIAALTAEGRLSALVLLLLPPGLTVFIVFSNPAYFAGIWDGVLAYALAGLAAALLGAGALWIHRLIAKVG